MFNIDEDDYLVSEFFIPKYRLNKDHFIELVNIVCYVYVFLQSRLARYQSPYPKDVKDRATQYLASRRQQHQQEIEVTQPVLPSQHQCHQQERHQYRYHYQHRKQHSVRTAHTLLT